MRWSPARVLAALVSVPLCHVTAQRDILLLTSVEVVATTVTVLVTPNAYPYPYPHPKSDAEYHRIKTTLTTIPTPAYTTQEAVEPASYTTPSVVVVEPPPPPSDTPSAVAPVYTSVPPPAPVYSAPATMPSYSANPVQAAILESTNKFREQYSAKPLEWNETLADFATEYASKCNWKHSGGPYGENLAAGYSSPSAAIDAWANEEDKYNWAKAAFGENTGHFTQLVWQETTQVGCANIHCATDNVPGDFLVCEYSPRGNMEGAYQSNVLKPVTKMVRAARPRRWAEV